MKDEKKLPHITSTLIKYLEETYPLKSPSIEDTERVIFFRAGMREVVDKIKQLYQEQKTRYK